MCMSCGCMQPNNDHGDQRNITMNDLEQSAQAANITPQQAANNIQSCCQQMGSSTTQGQQASASPQSPS